MALRISYGLSSATTTGVNIEEGQVTKLRHRNRTLASEAKTVPTPDILASDHLAANIRAAVPVGKQHIEKERKRREKERKKKEVDDIGWKVPRDFILRTDINESVYCSVYDYRRPIQVEGILTTSYTPGAVDEYKG